MTTEELDSKLRFTASQSIGKSIVAEVSTICLAPRSEDHIGNERCFLKETDYRQRLDNHDDQETTIRTQIYRVKRVEAVPGNLDKHYAQDRMASVIEDLQYSRDDQLVHSIVRGKLILSADNPHGGSSLSLGGLLAVTLNDRAR